MELHHKLRRDPNWHPNACNICGGMGHQAANCKTGTIKWREVFGNEAFIVRKPVFMTDILKKRAERQVDYAKLEADAIEFAKRQCEASGMSYSVIEQGAAKSQSIDCEALLKEKAAQFEAEEMKHKRRKENVAAAAPATAAAEGDLPPGWAIAHDSKGKPYYWHTSTMKVQWDRPTAATPVN